DLALKWSDCAQRILDRSPRNSQHHDVTESRRLRRSTGSRVRPRSVRRGPKRRVVLREAEEHPMARMRPDAPHTDTHVARTNDPDVHDSHLSLPSSFRIFTHARAGIQPRKRKHVRRTLTKSGEGECTSERRRDPVRTPPNNIRTYRGPYPT